MTNHRFLKIGCLAAALVLALGCDAWLTKPSLYNTVQVVATRRNGDPIPHVGLVLYTGQRQMGYGATDSSGRFTFTRVPQGFYGVAADPPAGYAAVEVLIGGPPTTVIDKLTVADDTLSPVRFTFLKRGPGSILARVVDAGGKPLAGVAALLYSSTQVFDSILTDESGLVTFRNVPFGAYGVSLTRPVLYRSYQHFEDSLYAHRDGIIVEEGSEDSIRFSLSRCTAQVRFRVTDQRGDPVFSVKATLYTSTAVIGYAFTDQAGVGIFPQAPCATPMGLAIGTPPGYTATPGRGTQFVDGFSLTSGATLDLDFVVQKNP